MTSILHLTDLSTSKFVVECTASKNPPSLPSKNLSTNYQHTTMSPCPSPQVIGVKGILEHGVGKYRPDNERIQGTETIFLIKKPAVSADITVSYANWV